MECVIVGYIFFVPDSPHETITLKELGQELGVVYSTVGTWAKDGRGGAKLRVCKTTRGLGTTREEYARFFREMNKLLG